jgi:uncharacterized membrane protein YeaQ/YmgE (transglycosylase-associated protein family)
MRVRSGCIFGPYILALGFADTQTQCPRVAMLAPLRKVIRPKRPSHSGPKHMNFLIWLVIGGVIGWLASMLMNTNDQQGIFLNVVVGVVGAMVAGWFISPLVGIQTINQHNFSLPALLVLELTRFRGHLIS